MYFTTNHDENSWNGTEFEKYGKAASLFAVLTQTMYQSIPLIYSGQEAGNSKRLKFFVKDTITWDHFPYTSFYETLLKLRKANRALASDAGWKILAGSNENSILAFERAKANHRIIVILNVSGTDQEFTLAGLGDNNIMKNVFTGEHETLSGTRKFKLKAYQWIVYKY